MDTRMGLSEIERDYYERRNGTRKKYHGAYVTFKRIKEFDPIATEKEGGLPQYKTYDIIEVARPGGDVTPVRVEDWHKKEYPEQWAAFIAGQEQPVDGTPLEQWPMMTVEACAQLKHFGIHTIEVLADLPDTERRKIGPLSVWCKKAKDWLGAANSKQTEVTALKAQVEKLSKQIEKYQADNEVLIQRIEATEGIRFREPN